MSDAEKLFEELFDRVSKQKREKEKLLSEIRQEMRHLRSWSRRGNIGPFTPYEFYRFLCNSSFSHEESIWCYEILTGCRYDSVFGDSVYLGEGWLKAFFTFLGLRVRYPQSFHNYTVYGGMTQ